MNRADFERIARARIRNTPGATLDPDAIAVPGSALNIITRIGTAMAEECESRSQGRFALWYRGLDSDLDRLAAGARGLPGIAASTAQEDIDLNNPDEQLPLGSVTIYVGDVDGKATEALLRRVKLALSGFRLLGQLVKVWGIVPQLVGLTLRFGVLDTLDVAQVRADVRAAMLLAVNRLGPGMPLRRPALESLLAGLPGVVLLPNVPPVVMFLQNAPPAGAPAASPDLVPTDPRTAYRTTAELITFA